MVVLESAFDHCSSMETSSLPPAMQLSVDTSSAMTLSGAGLSATPGSITDVNQAAAAAASLACSMKMLPKRFINLHNYFNPISSLSLKKQIRQVAVSRIIHFPGGT
uniref:Uncharacterized protein n=1 Tax=Cacopsylla melanoneura TaxID=428564 RepID=A0A8D8MBL8_9HEMI